MIDLAEVLGLLENGGAPLFREVVNGSMPLFAGFVTMVRKELCTVGLCVTLPGQVSQ